MTDPAVRRVPDADLGAVFGNRTDGLGGLAPRRPRVVPTPIQPEPTQPETQQPRGAEAKAQAQDVEPAQPRSNSGRARTSTDTTRPPARRPARAPARGTDSVVPRLVILQLPNAVADQLRDHARQRGVTYKEMTLDAVEATADQLTELLAAQRPKVRGGGLFAAERVAAQARPEARRQVSIKLTEASISALDELASSCGARSRSELVATALAAYLSN